MGNSAPRNNFRTIITALTLGLTMSATLAVADSCSPDTIDLKGTWGSARFTVEVADDPAEQAQGLMNRTELAMAAGMYFVNERPRRTSFWMRNTLLPLDMIFIKPNGTIAHIHDSAQPLDETPVSGGQGNLAVLEINGGLSKKLGIAPGDVVQHTAFADTDPIWPCE